MVITFSLIGCNDEQICPGCVNNETTTPTPGEICNNGSDDDNDGFTDCADPDCAYNEHCLDEICDNGRDDDGDDDIDCDDIDCQNDDHCNDPSTETSCTNGIDDDDDGDTDCDDSDCDNHEACDETPDSEVGLCDDNIDNDNDGRTDCDDEDCENDSACGDDPVEICDNGSDDDGDGDADCEDPDCYIHDNCRPDDFNTFITANDPDGSGSQFEVGGVEHSGTDAGSWVSRVITGFVLMFNVYDETISEGTANHDAVFYMSSAGCTLANILKSSDSDSRINVTCVDGTGDDYDCNNVGVYAFCGPVWSGVHAQVNLMGLIDDTDIYSVYVALSLGEISGLSVIVGNTTLVKSAVEALSSSDKVDLWNLFNDSFIELSAVPRYQNNKSSGSDQVNSLPKTRIN